MSYDLNIPCLSSTPTPELERTIAFLASLGYTTLALSQTHNASSLPSQVTNTIPLPPILKTPSKTTILRRCTLILSDPAHNPRLTALSQSYDILALRPTTEKAYLSACLSMPEISIISLDLTQRFGFHFKPKPLMTAVNRGVRFEINYAQAVQGDGPARRNFISNAMAIIRGTKGRGIVISSEATDVIAVRAPADVLNLLGVWGLGRERGLEALGVNPRGVVVNEGLKRSGFRGVIDVVNGGERPVVERKEGGKESAKAKTKRKVEETTVEGTPPISKRQAKRMKLEALKASKANASSQSQKEGSSSPQIKTQIQSKATTSDSTSKLKPKG
ncbi:hypothetical protein HYFRA_00012297 [Hymenoscyphus fraxineus]|uniref:Uncharacterized protein n=1 Tax=Hymenoscyphus fraxineus TaxID=746836 RepID=A0A9N9PWQ1_9HELO|nr:hypothetical protein HYFRA_00012297 [Hymenoscyphus fraxineus]